MRKPVHAAIATAVLLAVTTLSGCGAGDDDPEIPSAGSGSPASDDSPSAPSGEATSRDDMLLRYAQCLRRHGVDVEDPESGEGIQLQIESEEEQATADAAQKACEQYAPPPGEEDPEAEREDMLETARCMREHGVETFPDPKPGEGIGIDETIASDPDFEAAEKACMGDAVSNSSGAQ
jgi:hypothetical protein